MISKEIHTNSVDRRPGRRRRRLALVVALILAVVVLHVLPTAVKATASQAGVELSRADGPESGDGRIASSLPREQFRETIEAAYEKLEIYTAGSGAGLEFELRDFMTYTRDDFSGVPLTDIATMPGGRVLDVVRNTRTHSDVDAGTERVTVQYSPRWRTKEPTWQLLPKAGRAADVTLAEAMSLRAQEDPAFRYVEAATSYHVTVSFEGESRTYRAAFLWFNQDLRSGWANFDLLALDHISQGVGKALRETVPVDGLEYTLPESRRESDGEPSLHPKVTCADTVVASDNFSEEGKATNEHLTGRHYASASFDFDCSCSSDCSQTCSAGVSKEVCEDDGQPIDACHKMAFDTAAHSASVIGGTASCTSGFRCIQKACSFCLCGLSVSVDIVAGQVTFGGEGGNWGFQRAWSFDCPACQLSDDGPEGPGGEDPCGAGVDKTMTASASLDDGGQGLGISSKRTMSSIVYPLRRSEVRDGERFVMDEWAIVLDGDVAASSVPEFGDAVGTQLELSDREAWLIVQKPVHVMNERHVPEPAVAVNSSLLPRGLRGNGEIVVARLEFSPEQRSEPVEILSTSGPVNEPALRAMLARRVRPSFASEKTHRAAAYVVLKITDSIQVLDTVSALPQCCCGINEAFCV